MRRRIVNYFDVVLWSLGLTRVGSLHWHLLSSLRFPAVGAVMGVSPGSGTSAPYGEGYSEYISVLQRTLLNLAAPQDTRAAQLLAQGAYNDDSQFVVDLARFGESLVPTIVDMSKHDVGPKRWNAYGLAGELVKQNRESRITISSTGITQLKDILRAAVILSDFSDKIIGVRHLGEAGDITDLPLLQNIAATDTSAGTGRVQFPIRNAALAAISAIKSRP